jgi:hypothetical protein
MNVSAKMTYPPAEMISHPTAKTDEKELKEIVHNMSKSYLTS